MRARACVKNNLRVDPEAAKPCKDLRMAIDADPAAWQNLRAAVLCIGLGEYKHLPVLPNATRDARALCEKVNALRAPLDAGEGSEMALWRPCS